MGIKTIAGVEKAKIKFKEAVFQHRLLHWYDNQNRQLPWRQDWLTHQTPYPVWVSEIMLQQTVIKAVLPVYARFMAALPTVTNLANSTEEDLRLLVKGLGYYRRFSFLQKAANQITANGPVEWPVSYSGWLGLAGVGEYTAAAISSICFDEAAGVVDGNVERVFCRLFDIHMAPNLPKLKKPFRRLANELISSQRPGDFNQALMELGQTICKPTAPECPKCPVASDCLANQRQTQRMAPQPKLKTNYENLAMELVILERAGKVALLKRPTTAKFLKQSWGFLTQLQSGDDYVGDGFHSTPRPGKSIGQFSHSITKHKLSIRVRRCRVKVSQFPSHEFQWINPDQIEEKLVASLDSKAWKIYQNTK